MAGRALAGATAAMEVADDRAFPIRLNRPVALVTEALAPAPATTSLTDATGSGSFVFKADEWHAGKRGPGQIAQGRNRPRA